MMKATKYFILILALLTATFFASCGSDDDDDNSSNFPEETKQDEGLPNGWYNSGALENITSRLIQDYLNAADFGLVEREGWKKQIDFVTAIHVINGSTFETVVGGATINRPSDYFASKSFSGGGHSYTLYWYFNYPYETYTSRPSGKWYDKNGHETSAPKYANGVITWGKNTFTKMNYTPKNW